jgi:hypothetical protein
MTADHGPQNSDGPIHQMFGLTYSSYFCVPRLALQEMPIEWQEAFVALVEQLPVTPEYTVLLRDPKGRRFITDPWRHYRRGTVHNALELWRAAGIES